MGDAVDDRLFGDAEAAGANRLSGGHRGGGVGDEVRAEHRRPHPPLAIRADEPEGLPERELFENLVLVERCDIDKGRAHFIAALRDNIEDGGVPLRANDRGRARLDDAGLVARDLRRRVPKDGRVFERDRGDHGDFRRVDHVCGVECPTEADFDDLPADARHLRPHEPEEQGGQHAEGAHVAVDTFAFGLDRVLDGAEPGSEFLRRDSITIDSDALGEGVEVGTRVQPGDVTRALKHPGDQRGGGAFAFRTGDMDRRAATLRVVQPRKQGADGLEVHRGVRRGLEAALHIGQRKQVVERFVVLHAVIVGRFAAGGAFDSAQPRPENAMRDPNARHLRSMAQPAPGLPRCPRRLGDARRRRGFEHHLPG